MSETLSNTRLVARLQTLSRLTGVLSIAVGCLVIVGWLFRIDAFTSVLPGLVAMKFNTALACVFSGIGLLNLRRQPRVTQAAALIVGLLGFVALLSLTGYIYSLQSLYKIGLFSSIALHTTITFITFGLGLIFSVPKLGLMFVLVADRAGALLMRRLLPAAVIVSLLLAWLQQKGQQADFLRTPMRNFPDRLRSVRVVFETTWRRLTDDERQGFQRLSVFRGGFTREAAQVVAGADLNILAGLVNKALLGHPPGGGRYEIHELLHQYAAEQLEASGDGETVLTAHQAYFGQLAHEWSEALRSPKQIAALDTLQADFDNIREAFVRAAAIRLARRRRPSATRVRPSSSGSRRCAGSPPARSYSRQ